MEEESRSKMDLITDSLRELKREHVVKLAANWTDSRRPAKLQDISSAPFWLGASY
jgi:hypothetical protein